MVCGFGARRKCGNSQSRVGAGGGPGRPVERPVEWPLEWPVEPAPRPFVLLGASGKRRREKLFSEASRGPPFLKPLENKALAATAGSSERPIAVRKRKKSASAPRAAETGAARRGPCFHDDSPLRKKISNTAPKNSGVSSTRFFSSLVAARFGARRGPFT
jgi:hypothetical protein